GNSPLYRDDIEYQSRRYFENRTRLLGWLDTHAGRDSARPLSVSGDDFEKGLRAGPVAMKLANRDYFTWRNDSRQENAATHTARCRSPSCRAARAEHETAFQECAPTPGHPRTRPLPFPRERVRDARRRTTSSHSPHRHRLT